MSKQVVVLGMHRSGTSLLSNLLINMGVYMGHDFIEPDEYNPRGYFEDTDFVRVNKMILREFNASWNNPPTRKQLESIARMKPHTARIEHVIRHKESLENDVWGWKDPRNSLTAFLYHPYLSNPHYIVVKRQPQNVLKSLRARNPDSKNWGEQLIETYERHIARFLGTGEKENLVINFEDLVRHPLTLLETLTIVCEFLDLDPLRVGKAAQIVEFENDKK